MDTVTYSNDSSCVLPLEVIKRKLCQILHQEGLQNSSVAVSSATGKGDNFMGVLYRILATGDSAKQLHLVCKTEPSSETRRRETRTNILFKREKLVYDELFPIYQQFQESKGIRDNLCFDNYPKAYGMGDGFLFMNDMREEGYKMYDRFKTLDYDHLMITIETLARFHAVGFALKQQRPYWFDKYKSRMKEEYFAKPINVPMYGYIRLMLDHIMETLEDHEEEMKKKVRRLKEDVEEKMPNYLDAEDAEPYAVITHGDCWNNNMIYKYKDGKPMHVCLLDYQLCRYGSPALDLAYCIFCCTNRRLREEHYADILRHYHRTLSDALRRLGSSPDKVFPYSALEDQMRRYGGYGLIMASLLVKTVMSSQEEMPDMEQFAEDIEANKEVKTIEMHGDTAQRYKRRMSSIIRDVTKLGMI